MRKPWQMGVDTWEGQLAIDEILLKEEEIEFFIIRLNDMNGGHHMDTGFHQQWEEAKGFVRGLYFVYNPWVNAVQNFQWLRENAPGDTTFVMIDVEVRKDDVTPYQYGAELRKFTDMCVDYYYRTVIYTGEAYLSLVDVWPTNVTYCWAQYPYELYHNGEGPKYMTGLELRGEIDLYEGPFNAEMIPGGPDNWSIWQCSGDTMILPGTTRIIDILVFRGSKAELVDFFGDASQQVDHPEGATHSGFVEATALNVRSGPGTEFEVAGPALLKDNHIYARDAIVKSPLVEEWIELLEVNGVAFAEGFFCAAYYGGEKFVSYYKLPEPPIVIPPDEPEPPEEDEYPYNAIVTIFDGKVTDLRLVDQVDPPMVDDYDPKENLLMVQVELRTQPNANGDQITKVHRTADFGGEANKVQIDVMHGHKVWVAGYIDDDGLFVSLCPEQRRVYEWNEELKANVLVNRVYNYRDDAAQSNMNDVAVWLVDDEMFDKSNGKAVMWPQFYRNRGDLSGKWWDGGYLKIEDIIVPTYPEPPIMLKREWTSPTGVVEIYPSPDISSEFVIRFEYMEGSTVEYLPHDDFWAFLPVQQVIKAGGEEQELHSAWTASGSKGEWPEGGCYTRLSNLKFEAPPSSSMTSRDPLFFKTPATGQIIQLWWDHLIVDFGLAPRHVKMNYKTPEDAPDWGIPCTIRSHGNHPDFIQLTERVQWVWFECLVIAAGGELIFENGEPVMIGGDATLEEVKIAWTHVTRHSGGWCDFHAVQQGFTDFINKVNMDGGRGGIHMKILDSGGQSREVVQESPGEYLVRAIDYTDPNLDAKEIMKDNLVINWANMVCCRREVLEQPDGTIKWGDWTGQLKYVPVPSLRRNGIKTGTPIPLFGHNGVRRYEKQGTKCAAGPIGNNVNYTPYIFQSDGVFI